MTFPVVEGYAILSGVTGPSGMSGTAGYAGPSGMSGTAGYTGPIGITGKSGYAEISEKIGYLDSRSYTWMNQYAQAHVKNDKKEKIPSLVDWLINAFENENY